MEVLLKIEDHAKKVHNERMIRLSNEPTVENLMGKLEEIFAVKVEYQEIFHGEVKIHSCTHDSLLSEIGVQNGDTLIFKHVNLSKWTRFEWIAGDIKKGKKVQQNVQEAVALFQLFEKSNFFNIYDNFWFVKRKFEDEFANYIDTEVKMVEEAARHFFSKPNPLVPDNKVEFEDKTSGAQTGTICNVTTPEGVVKYYIKSHMHTSSRPPNKGLPDLRELFVYKLLEFIELGPKVFFIPNNHHSKFGFYIATRAVDNFVEKCDAKHGRFNDEHFLKLDVLRHVLFLTDLHSKNYGINGNGDLTIVDFQIHNRKTASGVKRLANDVNKEILDFVKSCDLLNNINKADSEMSALKILLKERGIEKQPSENYTRYLAQIKKNVELIQGESTVKDDEESVSNLDAPDAKKPRYNP